MPRAERPRAKKQEVIVPYNLTGDQQVTLDVRPATAVEDSRGRYLAAVAAILTGAIVGIGFLIFLLMRGPAAELLSPEAALAKCVNAATVATRGNCSHATIVDGCTKALIPGVDYKE